MTDTDVSSIDQDFDELGPVDFLVVEFPADSQNFHGEVARQLQDLIERNLIKVFDIVILKKDADGSVDVIEVSDYEDDDNPLRAFEASVASLLAEADIEAMAEVVEPGSVAAVLVWENAWAAPFASALRHAGGQLVASGRIPVQAIIAALEDEDEDEDAEEEGGN